MIIRPGWWTGFFTVLALLLAVSAAGAQDTPLGISPIDTSRAEPSPAPPDSVRENTEKKVADILTWLRQTKADTADTAKPQPAPLRPPVLGPLGPAQITTFCFPTLAAYPHTAFSDHLVESAEFDAAGTTEYATERMFSYRGLKPLGVKVSLDGFPLELQRLTFPQTMAPDLMTVPPYLFSSFALPCLTADNHSGPSILLRTADSVPAFPISDFFVRRGDYGLSLTQGRLFRPLPGRRTIDLGFSFAQSDGRGLYNRGNNRFLHGRLVTPLRRGYNVLLDFYQYRALSDVQTTLDWWRYNFRRDDLEWHAGALVFHGDSVYSPLLVRVTVQHNKQALHSNPQAYNTLMKTSRAEVAAVYAPPTSDSGRAWRAGGTIALDQFHVRSEHFRRPDYILWGERIWHPAAQHTLHAAARVDGNDHDPPGPQLALDWRLDPGSRWHVRAGMQRDRIIPTQADRKWPLHSATLENLEDQVFAYSDEGAPSLAPWWSNSINAEFGCRIARGLTFVLAGWSSYEQDYYSWRDVGGADSVMMYRPATGDARTAGMALHAGLPSVGPFTPRLWYVYKRAEEVTGRRLPDYFDHRLNGVIDADLAVPRFNLNLHGSAEFMYWRAPSPEYTAYNRRDVFRTDVLGSATIKDFTIYWLAQNLFNYGYCKAPGFTYTGRTIMWGLHLRFFN